MRIWVFQWRSMGNCGPVFILEDDDLIREALQTAIEIEGYEVLTACNGEEGLRLLSEPPVPCIIFTDLFMPVMDGFEFIKVATENKILARVPIVVCSATPHDGEVKKIKDSGKVKEIIKKPFDLEHFFAIVRKYCRTA